MFENTFPRTARLASPNGARTGLYPCRCHSWPATFHRASRAGCPSSTGMKRHLPCFRTPLVCSLGGLRFQVFSVQGPSTKCDPAVCSELQKLQGRFRSCPTGRISRIKPSLLVRTITGSRKLTWAPGRPREERGAIFAANLALEHGLQNLNGTPHFCVSLL